MDIVRGVAQRNIDTEAPYDDICPEDAWRELADLSAPELADRFHELDSAQQPFTAWRYGNDPASRQLAQAVSRLPANAHIRGLQRAAGLARFASIDAVGRLGLRSGDGREELIAAIDHLSEADARSLLHDLAMWAPDRAWNSIRHEAFFDGLILLY